MAFSVLVQQRKSVLHSHVMIGLDAMMIQKAS